ncbi:FecR domain-containing protein [Chitinivorax sp. B]|uniref:FecR domain-containing protein n=1 Tax=Chitinivorax sp. B TaxID=2502235 RepID=UPI0010F71CD1|nr:FecR domain-containing protein [Chitinivorax sp. B]
MAKQMFWLATALVISTSASAAPVGMVTFLEGDSLLTRGVTRFKLPEGTRLEPTDIVEVSGKGFLQIELSNGAILLLAPQTRAMLQPNAKSTIMEVFVLSGAIKVKTGTAPVRLTTPAFELPLNNATGVANVGTNTGLFMERGSSRLEESLGDQLAAPVALAVNAYWSRTAQTKSQIAARPTPAFVSSLPPVFLDDPASRLAKFTNTKVNLNKAPDFNYADVEPWLMTSPVIRKVLVSLWKPKLSDPAFKAAMLANQAQLPEWERLLAPPKPAMSSKAASEMHSPPSTVISNQTKPANPAGPVTPTTTHPPKPVPAQPNPTATAKPGSTQPATQPMIQDEGHGQQRRKPY